MTKFSTFLFSFVLILLTVNAQSQARFYGECGLSYIEHFSLSGGIRLGDRHNVALIYGTNLFISTNRFSNLFIQYHYKISQLTFLEFTPVAGIKGGNSIFSDNYYTWKVISVIPFAGVERPLSSHLSVFLHAGAAFSFEQSVVRLKFGEVGHYRDKLPEVKVGIQYLLK